MPGAQEFLRMTLNQSFCQLKKLCQQQGHHRDDRGSYRDAELGVTAFDVRL